MRTWGRTGICTMLLACLAATGARGGDLVINEFLAVNNTNRLDKLGQYSDWIELHNNASSNINLAGWHLTDNSGNLTKWTFPTTNIAAYGYVIVVADGGDVPVTNGELHASFSLSGGGEYLALVQPGGVTVAYSYNPKFPAQVADVSYGIGETNEHRYLASPTPGGPNNFGGYFQVCGDTKFNPDRGVYFSSVAVTVTCATAGSEIRYTTNGSAPTESSALYSGPIPITNTTCLRAAAFKTGYKPSNSDTHTYIFPECILRQPAGPPGFPTVWTNLAGTVLCSSDYAMDPRVATNPAYSGEIIADLQSIPSMSIVMNVNDLFDRTIGIYANADQQDGTVWERAGSIEFMHPDGTPGFQENCGVQMYGGYSRNLQFKKHSFRLLFKDDYGETKLKYPLFGEGAVEEFDTVILRAGFNDSYMGNAAARYITDEWVRRAQLAMGQESAHGEFVHLYVNGLYWGLYNLTERPDAAFASSYYGGDKLEYDAMHIGVAVDGDATAWNTAQAIAAAGVATRTGYTNLEAWVDIDNLIDYMLVNFYASGNWDWDHNNWSATRRRLPGAQYKFFCWDSEFALNVLGVGQDMTGEFNAGCSSAYYKYLRANPEFNLQFGDHVHKHCFNNGVLVSTNARAIFVGLTNEVYGAVVCESARWGDWNGGLATRDGQWLSAVTWVLDSFFPPNHNLQIQNFRNAGLYPSLTAPVFSQHGGLFTNGFALTISATSTVYYTLDGTDPREPWSGTARGTLYTNPVVLPYTVQVKARAFVSTNLWSALNEASFVSDQPHTLAITEVMFNPRIPMGSELGHGWTNVDFEFLEVKNIGNAAIGLAGTRLTDGVTFDFSGSRTISLGAGEYAVVVRNLTAFTNRYAAFTNVNIAGEYQREDQFSPLPALADGGEQVRLVGPTDEPLADFEYSDGRDWPLAADGAGHSLVPQDMTNQAAGVLDYPGNWRASAYIDGSPGRADPPPVIDVLLNEIMAHTDYTNELDSNDWIELYNTLLTQVSLTNWYLSDDATNLTKWAIPGSNTISGHGIRTFFEQTGFHNPTNIGFGLDKGGEQVFLSYLPGDTNNRVADGVRFKGQENGHTLGRYPDGGWPWRTLLPTTNLPNSVPPVPPVVISEIMYHPFPTAANPEDNENDEYIELYNWTASPVKLMNLTNDVGPWRINGGVQYLFPSNTTIPAGGRLVLVSFDPAVKTNKLAEFIAAHGLTNGQATIIGPYSGRLSNRGDRITLEKPLAPDQPGDKWSWVIVDEVTYMDRAPWPAGTDGTGYPLQLMNESVAGNQPDDWEMGFLATPGWQRTTPGNWPYRMKITLSGYNRAETLTNFPLLAVFSTNIPDFSYGQFWSAQGRDLRLFNSSGTNAVMYEIEGWNTSGTSHVWVLVPRISNSTDYVWACWGYPSVRPWPYCATNGEVWGAYDLVMHMSETSGTNAPDATASKRAGVLFGAYAWQPGGGRVGGALRMTGDATNDRIVLPAGQKVQLANEWTISSWFKNMRAGTSAKVLASGDGGELQVDVRGAASTLRTWSPMSGYPSGTNLVVPLNEWHHLTAVGIGTKTLFYLDGAHIGTNSAYKATNDVRYINNSTNAVKFAEYLDEFRISNVGRSTNWIWAEWMNQASNSVLATYAMVQQGGGMDVDGDGMADAWEMIHFFATNAPECGPLEDKDKDGYLNKWEYIAGTDPTNKESVFEVDIIHSNGVPTVRFYARSVAGGGYESETRTRYYDLEDRTNMLGVALDWAGVLNKTNISGNNNYVEQTNPPSVIRRFFRARARLE